MAKKDNKIDNSMVKAVELTKKSARATLDGAVKTAELSESYIQGIYKAGYEANYDALKVAKGYWDATTEIRKDWVKLFAAAGEEAIERAATLDVPYKKEAVKMGSGFLNSVTKTIDGFMPQSKGAK